MSKNMILIDHLSMIMKTYIMLRLITNLNPIKYPHHIRIIEYLHNYNYMIIHFHIHIHINIRIKRQMTHNYSIISQISNN